MKLPSCTRPQGFDSHTHSFRSKIYHKNIPCQYCQQPITRLGSSCRVCKYTCHPECQPRVAASCETAHLTHYRATQNQDGVTKTNQSPFYLPPQQQQQQYQQYTLPKSHSLPFSKHFTYHTTYRVPERSSDVLEMDLTYITERVIVMTFPLVGNEKVYRENLREMTQMLKTKHGDKYMFFNLSERRYDIARLNRQVLDFGWPDRLAPPLERICSICKAMDSWLNSDPQHIVVLHSKGGKERVGIVTEAYRHYSSICASTDQALDRFAMKRFYDDKIGNLSQPSQKRYIRYFSGLLSGAIKINSTPLYLHHVMIHGVPNYDGKGGCKAFLKVYQGMHQIYSSGIYNVTSTMGRVFIPLEVPLQLRGDVMLKCYHKARSTTREVIFRCQFHSCAISDHHLTLTKEELDDASQDKRFPESGRVELKFSSGPEQYHGNGYEAIHPVESSNDPVVRWDSYENFDIVPEDNPESLDELDSWPGSLDHTEGPVDGNLYATVSKRRLNGNVDDLVNGMHTVSMDSGISSATPLITNGTPSSQSPVTHADIHAVPSSTLIPNDEQSKLDAVLTGMLLDAQNMPDIKPSKTYTTYTLTSTSVDRPPDLVSVDRHTRVHATHVTRNAPPPPPMAPPSHDGEDEPYHACKDSRPFTYLVPSSPSAQRKHLPGHVPIQAPPPMAILQQKETIMQISREEPLGFSPTPTTPEPKSEDEFMGDPDMWLYRQQQKLRERKELRVHGDRHRREEKLIHELRNTQHHQLQRTAPMTPSSTADSLDDDSYISDTIASLEAFSSRETSPGKGAWTNPLHINTYNGYASSQSTSPYVSGAGKPPVYQTGSLRGSAPTSPLIPSRTSSRDVRVRYNYSGWPAPAQQPIPQQQQQPSRPVQRQRSDTSHDRERPFVVVKRAHEAARKQGDPGYPSFAYSATSTIAPTPLATSSPAQKPGLLATVPGTKSEPKHVPMRLTDLEMSLHAVSSPVAASAPTAYSVEPIIADPRRSPEHKQRAVYATVESSSYWSQDEGSVRDEDRPITPGFPVQPRTPYFNRAPSPGPGHQATGLPPKSPTTARRALNAPGGPSARPQLRRWPSSSSSASTNSKDRSPSPATVQQLKSGIGAHTEGVAASQTGQSSPSVYFGQSRRNSISSLTDNLEVISHSPTFMKDTSKYWYKPNISREDAINMLKEKPPGTFVVRDSNSFPGAYGLALKVATPPPNVQNKSGDMSNELVRHFLIEPTNHGVRLKGCTNEPVFGSLSALVYQHSITAIALPCKLLLPDSDLFDSLLSDVSAPSSAAQLLAQGAACNVLYLYSVDTELLTGPEAIRKAVIGLLAQKPLATATAVHFKVSSQGITVTDNSRKLFFRRHYPVNAISHCGLDPGDRRWTQYHEETGQALSTHRIFGFVSAKRTDPSDNMCHLFAELEPEQPAFAIVNFVTKVMMSSPAPSTPLFHHAPSTPISQRGTYNTSLTSNSGTINTGTMNSSSSYATMTSSGVVNTGVISGGTTQRRMLSAMSPEDQEKCCD